MKYIIPIFAIVFLVIPVVVEAACLPSAFTGMPRALLLCQLIDKIALILYWAALGFAVIMIIIGGIQYITAGSDEEKVKGARKTIINGLIGAAIIFAAGFLIGMVGDLITNNLGS